MEQTERPKASAKPVGECLMEAIVMEYETALLRYAQRITGSHDLAQDVVQNAFIRLARKWRADFRPSPQMKSWLYRVTHNEAVDQIRREVRHRERYQRAAVEAVEPCPDGIHCDLSEDRRNQVLELLGSLRHHEQQVVLLRLQQGLSYAQIAEVTGRSQGNVGNILHHAVAKLARLVRSKAPKGGLQ